MATTSTRVEKSKKSTSIDTELLQKMMESTKNNTVNPEIELKNSFGLLENENEMEIAPTQEENEETTSTRNQKPPPIIITSQFKDLKAFHNKMKSLIAGKY
ncbi:hypothetical protein WA026_007558 [Henosepilachna vigintioctopunctata]|uniref:Uncharacterized protein n=1 Tax=Henosepilachna vigintioctopunctata TaxID=420089 RepID=A0AAW1UU95_9CUCU